MLTSKRSSNDTRFHRLRSIILYVPGSEYLMDDSFLAMAAGASFSLCFAMARRTCVRQRHSTIFQLLMEVMLVHTLPAILEETVVGSHVPLRNEPLTVCPSITSGVTDPLVVHDVRTTTSGHDAVSHFLFSSSSFLIQHHGTAAAAVGYCRRSLIFERWSS